MENSEARTIDPSSVVEPSGLSERASFRITCLRNAHYHEDRERFFARLHKLTMFIVVASGTASLAVIKAVPALAALITFVGLVDLVFDVSGKARLHASLRRRVYDLLAQAEVEAISVGQLKEQAIRIYADEPPCMYAVNALAYNAAMDSLGRPRKYRLVISGWYRFWRHWASFSSVDFKTSEEIEANKHVATVK